MKYVSAVEGNLLGTGRFDLGPLTLIHGTNGSGKTRITDSVRLALIHEVLGRPGRSGDSPDRMALAYQGAHRLWVKAELNTGQRFGISKERNANNPSATHKSKPESLALDPVTTFPYGPAFNALFKSSEKATSEYLLGQLPDVAESRVLECLSEAAEEVYGELREAVTKWKTNGGLEMPVSGSQWVGEIEEEIKRRLSTAQGRLSGAEATIAKCSALGYIPSEEEVATLAVKVEEDAARRRRVGRFLEFMQAYATKRATPTVVGVPALDLVPSPDPTAYQQVIRSFFPFASFAEAQGIAVPPEFQSWCERVLQLLNAARQREKEQRVAHNEAAVAATAYRDAERAFQAAVARCKAENLFTLSETGAPVGPASQFAVDWQEAQRLISTGDAHSFIASQFGSPHLATEAEVKLQRYRSALTLAPQQTQAQEDKVEAIREVKGLKELRKSLTQAKADLVRARWAELEEIAQRWLPKSLGRFVILTSEDIQGRSGAFQLGFYKPKVGGEEGEEYYSPVVSTAQKACLTLALCCALAEIRAEMITDAGPCIVIPTDTDWAPDFLNEVLKMLLKRPPKGSQVIIESAVKPKGRWTADRQGVTVIETKLP